MPQPFALAIEGMHCGACVRRVTAAIEKLGGVTALTVSVGNAAGTLETVTEDEVKAAIVRAGFTLRGERP